MIPRRLGFWIALGVAGVLAVPGVARAQPAILNQIANDYANVSVQWLNTLEPIAQRLFAILATIELVWSGIWWAFKRGSDDSVISAILLKVFTIMFLYSVVLFSRSWIPMIVSGFITAGFEASGFRRLNPSAVLGLGIDTSVLLWDNATEVFSWWQMPLWVYVVPLLIVLCFAFMAGILLMTLVESFLVIGGGVLMLGFLGSRWTITLAEGYLLTAIKVGLKLFVLYLLIGVGMALPEQWILRLADVNPADPRYFFEVLGGALVLAMIVWRVPIFAAQMIHHRASLGVHRAYQDPT